MNPNRKKILKIKEHLKRDSSLTRSFVYQKKQENKKIVQDIQSPVKQNIVTDNDPLSKDISQEIKDRIKKENILVSIFGASIRPKYWMNLYNNIKNNNYVFIF